MRGMFLRATTHIRDQCSLSLTLTSRVWQYELGLGVQMTHGNAFAHLVGSLGATVVKPHPLKVVVQMTFDQRLTALVIWSNAFRALMICHVGSFHAWQQ
jgi:hypothetical protein